MSTVLNHPKGSHALSGPKKFWLVATGHTSDPLWWIYVGTQPKLKAIHKKCLCGIPGCYSLAATTGEILFSVDPTLWGLTLSSRKIYEVNIKQAV